MYYSIISIIKDGLKLKEKDFRLISNKLFFKKVHRARTARMDFASMYSFLRFYDFDIWQQTEQKMPIGRFFSFIFLMYNFADRSCGLTCLVFIL